MSALVPNYYGNFSPQIYFNPFKSRENHYNDGEFLRRQTMFPLYHPTQSLHQTTFLPPAGYPMGGYHQYGRSGIHTTPIIHSNGAGSQYQNTWPYLNRMQGSYWRGRQDSGGPLSTYSGSYSSAYPGEPLFQYEREIRYVPYPIYVGPGGAVSARNSYLGYNAAPSLGRPGLFNTPAANFRNAGSLPPKIRVIFIPPGTSSVQQSYGNSLAMPPFLFNRMAQPFCSLPVPPPLPQIGSLPITPAVQQMIMQQYANPVAVLPFTPNYQATPPIMPIYPPILPQQPMISTSACQPNQFTGQPYQFPGQQYPSAPQPYPSIPQPYPTVPQPYPSAPQPYPSIPQPYPSIPQPYPSAPQPYPSIPQQYPSAPQPYPVSSQPCIPPPQMSNNMPVLSANVPPPMPLPYPTSAMPGYPANNYPDTCRACIPAPPSLNISVTGHCWIQHCSACHHIPTDISQPNIRPNTGRVTPLLRYPTVLQDVQNQRTQQEQYPHINTSVNNGPWLHQLPPLPPGAIIISDEYITRNDVPQAYHYSQNIPARHTRVQKSLPRSMTLTTNNSSYSGRNKSQPRKKQHEKRNRSSKSLSNSKSNDTTIVPYTQTPNKSCLSNKTDGPADDTSTISEDQKPDVNPTNDQQDHIHTKLSTLIRNIELRYKHQIPDMESVYHTNDYIKTSDEDSSSFQNSVDSSNLLTSKECHQNSLPLSNDLNSLKNDEEKEEDKKSLQTLPSVPCSLEQTRRRLIIIRQFMRDSPSVISAISSSTINEDSDSESTTSTIKPGENNVVIDETH